MKPALFLPALGLALGLAGCVNFGERSNTRTVVNYVLNDPALNDPAPVRADVPQDGMAARRVPTLLVLDTTTGGFYDTEQIVFSRSAGTRGQYQFARWTERPGKRFADLMRARLARLGAWNVSAAGGYVRGDMLLDTELIEFYHDAASEPGQMRLVLRAELVDLKQRTLLGRRVFEQQVPLATYDAAGAAQAANLAVSRALDELAAWLAMRQ
ncbi:MAG: PqiC family protein [Gammaproteobacteria bacterium]|nr:PqiC family protein [Gammaproteobacteria bacterium]